MVFICRLFGHKPWTTGRTSLHGMWRSWTYCTRCLVTLSDVTEKMMTAAEMDALVEQSFRRMYRRNRFA